MSHIESIASIECQNSKIDNARYHLLAADIFIFSKAMDDKNMLASTKYNVVKT